MKQPGCLPEGQSHSGSVFAAALWCLCGETPCLMSTLINFVNDRSMWACRMLRCLKTAAHLPFWVRTGLGFPLNKHTIKPKTEENVPSRWHPFNKKSKKDMGLLNSMHIPSSCGLVATDSSHVSSHPAGLCLMNTSPQRLRFCTQTPVRQMKLSKEFNLWGYFRLVY